MLLDANVDADVPAELSSELVIVGAGTVGLFLAEVLAGLGERRDVILVEAGSKVPGTSSNAARSTSVGRPHEGVHLGRAAGLGGTSSLWGGQLAEFSPADLEREDAAWPLTYEELRGHYRDVYRILGMGNPESGAFYRERLGAEAEEAEPIER